MATNAGWQKICAQMARHVTDCARCGLPFRQRKPDQLLCLGCEAVWIRAGRPEDELPPMSDEHWQGIQVEDLKPARRRFAPAISPTRIDDIKK